MNDLEKRVKELERIVRDLGGVIGPGGRVKRLRSANLTIEDGLTIYNPSTGKVTVRLEPDGDSFFGHNVAEPESISFIIFSNDQEYNGEDVGEGDVLLGDNTSGQANILWDRSTGKFLLRGGTTTQLELDATGKLTAGGGKVMIYSSGLKIHRGTAASPSSLMWVDPTNPDTIVGQLFVNASDNIYLYCTGWIIIGDQGSVEPVLIQDKTNNRFKIVGGDDSTTDLTVDGGLAVGFDVADPPAGAVLLGEIADPAAPDANQGVVYVRDNGSGKTQLVVRFPTGAIQVIATEP
jgi:hypothetical protein